MHCVPRAAVRVVIARRCVIEHESDRMARRGHMGDAERVRFRDDLVSAQSVVTVVGSSNLRRGDTPASVGKLLSDSG